MGLPIRPWEGYIPPCRIFGNLYFVGTEPASTHIIDTGEGLIMLDSGYKQSLYLVMAGMQDMGLNFRDIKYIVHSHGHYDHFGATKALVELCGAKTFLGAEDEKIATGELDLSWGKELGCDYYEFFKPDVLLHDGDKITLGNTVMECVASPGHTAGAMSFFWEAHDGEKSLKCGTFGGFGINTMRKEWLDRKGLPYTCRTDFIKSIDRLVDREVDIAIGNHAYNNNTAEKIKTILSGGENGFIDGAEWKKMLLKFRKIFFDEGLDDFSK